MWRSSPPPNLPPQAGGGIKETSPQAGKGTKEYAPLAGEEPVVHPLPRSRGRAREGAAPQWKNSHELIENANQLRQNCTDVEHLLWQFLRRKQLKGYKFRRQHPIEKYVADFACIELKLIIELDGGQHNDAPAQCYDAKRTQFLEEKGYNVLRFWNNEVLENIEGVMEVIWNTLPGADCPTQAGGGINETSPQAVAHPLTRLRGRVREGAI